MWAAMLFLATAAPRICGQATFPETPGGGPCPPSVEARQIVPGLQVPLAAPVSGIRIVNTYPHDPDAFTQGLLFRDGFIFESTGIGGKSGIRKVELETGRVVKKQDLAPRYFGEGLTDWEDTLVQITWHAGKGFIYDLNTFELKREFSYTGEGWGITKDEKSLIMSNGSNRLTFLNPRTMAPEKFLDVLAGGAPVHHLNELEVVEGEILANVWLSDFIARISPKTGEVTGWIDLSELRKQIPASGRAEVLNGIAWDAEKRRLFVTGKYWPKLFEVEIIPRDK